MIQFIQSKIIYIYQLLQSVVGVADLFDRKTSFCNENAGIVFINEYF